MRASWPGHTVNKKKMMIPIIFFHFKLAKNQTAKWAMAIDSDFHSNELLIYIYKFEKLNHLP